jgi:hypothetical protein
MFSNSDAIKAQFERADRMREFVNNNDPEFIAQCHREYTWMVENKFWELEQDIKIIKEKLFWLKEHKKDAKSNFIPPIDEEFGELCRTYVTEKESISDAHKNLTGMAYKAPFTIKKIKDDI